MGMCGYRCGWRCVACGSVAADRLPALGPQYRAPQTPRGFGDQSSEYPRKKGNELHRPPSSLASERHGSVASAAGWPPCSSGSGPRKLSEDAEVAFRAASESGRGFCGRQRSVIVEGSDLPTSEAILSCRGLRGFESLEPRGRPTLRTGAGMLLSAAMFGRKFCDSLPWASFSVVGGDAVS